MMVFDASSLYGVFRRNRLDLLKNASTIPLARYELGNVLWKEIILGKRYSRAEGIEIYQTLEKMLEKVRFYHPDYVVTLGTAIHSISYQFL